MTGKALADQGARDVIRGELDRVVVVEAAAGTGKTTELVARVVALVARGERLGRMVAVTFTEKAAGEMKLRLRKGIEAARLAAREAEEGGDVHAAERRAHLEAGLAELEVARIGTIHAFCADLLRERPIEARIDPSFEVLDEDGSAALLGRAFSEWFERALVAPTPALRRALRRPSGRTGVSPSDALREAAGRLIEDRDFDAAWEGPAGFDREAELDALLAQLGSLAELVSMGAPTSGLVRAASRLTEPVLGRLAREERVARGRDYDGFETALRAQLRDWDAWKQKGRSREFPTGARDALLTGRDRYRDALEAFVARADAQLASELREDLRAVVTRYEELKARSGRLDFTDLMLRTRELLVSDAGVRATWQRAFTHLFVDEFQDTDPLQADILLLLASEPAAEIDRHAREAWRAARVVPGKLFVVGDPKQSIYRFRRADVRIYEAVKRELAQQGAAVVYLETSFRARPEIQRLVNAAFAPAMHADAAGTQADYVALRPHRSSLPQQPALVAISPPRLKQWLGKPTKGSVNASLPDAMGAYVAWLVRESGWQVEEGGELVPLAPRHVCLLFRSLHSSYREDPVRAHLAALESRGVPHVLVGGRTFHSREEVSVLRAALMALEWPDDELAIYATLHGPLFGFRDDTLFAYKRAAGSLSYLSSVARRASVEEEGAIATGEADSDHRARAEGGDDMPPAATEELISALGILRALHRRRNRRPLAETVAMLLEEVRAHASFAFWPSGDQVLANVLRVVDHARRFDARGVTSFRAFVTWLIEAAENERDAGNAPVVEEGSEGVRVMTVHRAKGLEFPVVLLCDPTENARRTKPSRYVDPSAGVAARPLLGAVPQPLLDRADEVLEAEAAESLRLLYVAATRARDLLVVPLPGMGRPEGWWLNPLYEALWEVVGEPEREVPGCPEFGVSSVLDAERPEETIPPGRHASSSSESAGVAFTMWDPSRLPGGAVPKGTLNEHLLVEDDDGQNEEGQAAYDAWRRDHQMALASGREKSRRAAPVTALVRGGEAEWVRELFPVATVQVVRSATASGRPSGPRFGTLVHALLAEASLESVVEEEGAEAWTHLERLARGHARLLGATEDERRAALSATRAALGHPLLQRAREADALRRETPILYRAPDGTLVEGIVDLAFRAEGVWTVVDFKTDLKGEVDPAYRLQVALYAQAIREATGEEAEALLFGV